MKLDISRREQQVFPAFAFPLLLLFFFFFSFFRFSSFFSLGRADRRQIKYRARVSAPVSADSRQTTVYYDVYRCPLSSGHRTMSRNASDKATTDVRTRAVRFFDRTRSR